MGIHANEFQLPPSQISFTQNAIGNVVEKLGDNLMLVHHDSKNYWWFATWKDGLYRFDRERIIHFITKHGLSHHRIDQIAEDPIENVYINTTAGINRFDGTSFQRF
jgi:ligand-binding sensor domain-containing protein